MACLNIPNIHVRRNEEGGLCLKYCCQGITLILKNGVRSSLMSERFESDQIF